MSQQVLEERVHTVEREVARHGEQLGRLQSDVSKIGDGVGELLKREAGRPAPLDGKALLTVAAAIGTMSGIVWWIIEHSPSMQSLRERVTKVEWRLDNPASWSTTTEPARRR